VTPPSFAGPCPHRRMTEVPDAAVRAAIAEYYDLVSDRPDPMVLSDEILFRRVLEAALPHLPPSGAGSDLEWLAADGWMVEIGRADTGREDVAFWSNVRRPGDLMSVHWSGASIAEAVGKARAAREIVVREVGHDDALRRPSDRGRGTVSHIRCLTAHDRL
jgi:hypothetical protein